MINSFLTTQTLIVDVRSLSCVASSFTFILQPSSAGCFISRTFMVANYIGDASFAFTGSLAAGLAGMDLLGCNLVGFITALGGGSLVKEAVEIPWV